MARHHNVIAVFDSTPRAQEALDRLSTQNFRPEQISLLVSDDARANHFQIHKGTKLAEGAAGGGAIGGLLGALVAGLATAAAIALPGLGLIAVGPLVAAFAGGGIGAAAGGIIGGLVGLGFNEHEAKLVEESVARGDIVVGVQSDTKDEADTAKKVFEECEAKTVAA